MALLNVLLRHSANMSAEEAASQVLRGRVAQDALTVIKVPSAPAAAG
jgi:hypothetical protein